MEKENTKVDKYGNEDILTIFKKLKLIHSAKFMASSLASHIYNLAAEICKT